ncbi:methyltransferase [Pseudomonas sp. ABC1]|uniref:class I SAM-dependent methyltransferase n=1 Tax=Pseudomonas sp. ABC1 TaxID=2748080 RepID=UPI0015C31230|nr:class I SAM-dependent methyltransferase [Pseudomonas sp. ABC1]QLF91702.1 methyltransferase [Pseudomonas sp. ABC1]
MDNALAHPLRPYWNLAAAPIQAKALELALSLGLFECLSVPQDVGSLASTLRIDHANAQVLLDLLWSMGLLERLAGQPLTHYQNSRLAKRFFTQDSPESCAQAWSYRAGLLRRFSEQIGDYVKAGTPATPLAEMASTAANWAQAAQVQIGQEQRVISVPALLERLDGIPAPERFLDLGGGPGFLAIALAERYPKSRGVVFELPDTAAVARQNIAQAGLEQRLESIAGNLDTDAIGEGYDLICCSSVFHFIDSPLDALRKVHAALRPGGLLVCVHAEIPEDAPGASHVLPFYLPMLLRGKYVPRQGEMASALRTCGFEDIHSTQSASFPLAPVWVHRGSRP